MGFSQLQQIPSFGMKSLRRDFVDFAGSFLCAVKTLLLLLYALEYGIFTTTA